MYKELAKYYDKIYSWKDYETESKKIHQLIRKYKKSSGNEMLDVACGTGNHIQYLRHHYNITGVDLNREMLAVAKKKFPGTELIQGDMQTFRINKQFDVIVCLFSAIAHMLTIRDLEKAINNFFVHLKEGGIVIIEPFISPEKYKKNYLHAIYVNEPDLKMIRMSVSKKRGNTFIFDFHFLIMMKNGIRYVNDRDSVRMFTVKEYLSVLKNSGLKVRYLKHGLMRDRGLYVGIKK